MKRSLFEYTRFVIFEPRRARLAIAARIKRIPGKLRRAAYATIRNRRMFMNLKEPDLYLDIGCGSNTTPDTINLDYHWRPGIDVCCDIRRGLPFPDNYVSGIFSEHCIEHIKLQEALAVFSEMRRVVVPGGYVRIVVPDLEIYLDRYRSKQPMPYAEVDVVAGLSTPAMSINRIMRAHGHQFIYDFETLREALLSSGFADVTKCRFNEGADAKLLLDTADRAVESLYVEARKPLTPRGDSRMVSGQIA